MRDFLVKCAIVWLLVIVFALSIHGLVLLIDRIWSSEPLRNRESVDGHWRAYQEHLDSLVRK